MVDKVTSIGKDKLLHFAVSAVIAVVVKMALLLILDYPDTAIVAVMATMVIGAGKEWYDKVTGKGSAEAGDSIADLVGAFVGAL